MHTIYCVTCLSLAVLSFSDLSRRMLFQRNFFLFWLICDHLPQSLIYNISADTTNLLINYGNIFAILFSLPIMYWVDTRGLRWPVLVSCFALFVCNGMRLFANDASMFSLVFVHVSFILNSVVGPIATGVATTLSETWFPPNERTTATAVGALGSQSGTVLLGVFVPLLCPDDASTPRATAVTEQFHFNLLLSSICLINLIMAVVYFPARPVTPPSASASVCHADAATVLFIF
jgi:FLVCR family MFS transporter